MRGLVLASNSDMTYRDEMTQAMAMLAAAPRTVFIGQAVACEGTTMSGTLAGVPLERRIELPVAEEMQMGMSIGLALAGHIPVSIFPRWNFLLLAANQLVNHLDKLPLMSGWKPKVIVRVGVGSERPMYPGPQHTGDFTDAFRSMCGTIHFEQLEHAEQIVPAYREALHRYGATVLVEYADHYQDR